MIIVPLQIKLKTIKYQQKIYLIINGYYKTVVVQIPKFFVLYKNKNLLVLKKINILENNIIKKDAFLGYYKTYLEELFNFLEVGYCVILELKGVGFRVKLEKNLLYFFLGLSHVKTFKLPKNIYIKVNNDLETELCLFGFNKQYLYEVVAQMKHLEYPDFYKGKGIFFLNEKINLKQGKRVET